MGRQTIGPSLGSSSETQIQHLQEPQSSAGFWLREENVTFKANIKHVNKLH